jgi:hypothetical protein
MNEITRVVPLRSPHRHVVKGDEAVERSDDRPVFVTQIGNTTLKIRSILPFMEPEERSQWFQDNADLPQVKHFKRVWAETLYAIEEQETKKESHGA